MAIIKCPECGREISSLAESCPHCGCPMKKKETVKYVPDEVEAEYNFRTIGSFISAGLLLLMGIGFIIGGCIIKKDVLLFVAMGIFMLLVSAFAVIIGIYRWYKTH